MSKDQERKDFLALGGTAGEGFNTAYATARGL
jgi:hypothetical protein